MHRYIGIAQLHSWDINDTVFECETHTQLSTSVTHTHTYTHAASSDRGHGQTGVVADGAGCGVVVVDETSSPGDLTRTVLS